MSIIGRNIKKIRTTKGLNQTDFGKLFNLTRGSIGSYEEGRAEPKIDTLKEIAKKFSISLDHIITIELTVNHLLGFSPENIINSDNLEGGALALPSVLPKSLLDRHGDLDLISRNTFFKTNLGNKFEFSLPFDNTIILKDVYAEKGDLLFCKKNFTSSSFGYLVLTDNQIYWQSQEPLENQGVIFTVVGLISKTFYMYKKNNFQEKMSELELRIINLESRR